ncbi:hypothetical protein SLE2022_159090 [Rubroshorea leprosula]
MAETPVKRQREETYIPEEIEEVKRQKSFNHILSLLESEEDEPTQDLSSLITSLQQELSSESVPGLVPGSTTVDTDGATAATTVEDYRSASCSSSSSNLLKDEEDVIRHLLEASDDELGIPNREAGVEVVGGGGEDLNGGGDGLLPVWSDGFWELEDEAANYYTLLQSELFM